VALKTYVREFSEAIVIKVTTKVNQHEGNQLGFPPAALSCKFKG